MPESESSSAALHRGMADGYGQVSVPSLSEEVRKQIQLVFSIPGSLIIYKRKNAKEGKC